MYTINGNYIEFNKNSKKDKIIENMDNSTASFNSLQFHDSNNTPASLTYSNNKIMLSKEDTKKNLTTMLDVDFANKTLGVYSNLNIQDNIVFNPNTDDSKPEVNKGLIFFNKNNKAVASIHKDSKDKSDLIFRTGYSGFAGISI